MVCLHGQRGLNQCRHFTGKERRESTFLNFVGMSFLDGPLSEEHIISYITKDLCLSIVPKTKESESILCNQKIDIFMLKIKIILNLDAL